MKFLFSGTQRDVFMGKCAIKHLTHIKVKYELRKRKANKKRKKIKVIVYVIYV